MRYLVTVVAYFDRIVEVEADNKREARELAEVSEHDGVRRDWRRMGDLDATDAVLEG